MRSLFLEEMRKLPSLSLPPEIAAEGNVVKVKHWKNYYVKRGFDEKTASSGRPLRDATELLTYPLTIAYSIQKLLATSADFRLPLGRPFFINVLGASYHLEYLDTK